MNDAHDDVEQVVTASAAPVNNEPLDTTPLEKSRFWAKVNKEGPIPAHRPELGSCWIWTRNKHERGYGQLTLRKKCVRAHRLSYVLKTMKPIPVGAIVCHHCDNPPCVNPDHLFIGSNEDNAKDRESKGRGHSSFRQPGWHAAHAHLVRRGDAHYRKIRPRSNRGEDGENVKLTNESVKVIRDEYALGCVSHLELARRFNVSQGAIRDVIVRKTWTHLP